MNTKGTEPTIKVHAVSSFTEEGQEIASAELWEVDLCVGCPWLLEGKAHLIDRVVNEAGQVVQGPGEFYDQASILGWMHEAGASLGWLSRNSEVSKAMLSYVLRGQKSLSAKALEAVLKAYGKWVNEHGCPLGQEVNHV